MLLYLLALLPWRYWWCLVWPRRTWPELHCCMHSSCNGLLLRSLFVTFVHVFDFLGVGDPGRSSAEQPRAGARSLEPVVGELHEAAAVADRGRSSCGGVHHLRRSLRLSHPKGMSSDNRFFDSVILYTGGTRFGTTLSGNVRTGWVSIGSPFSRTCVFSGQSGASLAHNVRLVSPNC